MVIVLNRKLKPSHSFAVPGRTTWSVRICEDRKIKTEPVEVEVGDLGKTDVIFVSAFASSAPVFGPRFSLFLPHIPIRLKPDFKVNKFQLPPLELIMQLSHVMIARCSRQSIASRSFSQYQILTFIAVASHNGERQPDSSPLLLPWLDNDAWGGVGISNLLEEVWR